MAVQTARKAFGVSGLVGATVPTTGFGFAPKAQLLAWSGTTTAGDEASHNNWHLGVGLVGGVADQRVVGLGRTTGGGGLPVMAHRTDACWAYVQASATPSQVGWAKLQSFNADGATYEILDSPPFTLRTLSWSLGGDDLTGIQTFSFLEPAAIGPQTVPLPFEFDLLVLVGTPLTTAPYPDVGAAELAFAGLSVGVVCKPAGSFEQAVVALGDQSASPTNTKRYARAGEAVALFDSGVTGLTGRLTVTGKTATGFTADWLDVAGAGGRYVHGLALKGCRATLQSLTTVLDTLTDLVATVGFPARGGLLLSDGAAEDAADTPRDHAHLALGAYASVASQGGVSVSSKDAVSAPVAWRAFEQDEPYLRLDPGGAGVVGKAKVTALDATTVTLRHTVADPDAARLFVLAVGDAPTGPSVAVRASALRRQFMR